MTDDVLHVDVEQGRISKLWFATAKEFPGKEGRGNNPNEAYDDLIKVLIDNFPRRVLFRQASINGGLI